MATNLPPFLVEYLLRQGLFSNRFSTPEDTQETPKKEQELTFEKVLQDILDGGLETADTTSVSSAPSPAPSPAPSSTTSSTGGLFGLGDIAQAINDVLSFDLGQAAIDAAEEATGRDLSFEGLFGIETPSFISDIQRATPGAVTSAIMSSPNQTTGAKVGAGLFNLMSGLIPSPLMALGVGLNMAGASNPFSAATDISVAYDPAANVTTISRDPETLGEDEPNVTRSELGFAIDIADMMSREMAGLDRSTIGINTPQGIVAYSPFDFGPMMGMQAAIGPLDPISQLTTSALDTLGFGGGFNAPGAFASRPDPTSPFGFAPGYHSPEFDPSGFDISDPDMSFDDPNYDPGFDEPGGYGGESGPGEDGNDTDPGDEF